MSANNVDTDFDNALSKIDQEILMSGKLTSLQYFIGESKKFSDRVVSEARDLHNSCDASQRELSLFSSKVGKVQSELHRISSYIDSMDCQSDTEAMNWRSKRYISSTPRPAYEHIKNGSLQALEELQQRLEEEKEEVAAIARASKLSLHIKHQLEEEEVKAHEEQPRKSRSRKASKSPPSNKVPGYWTEKRAMERASRSPEKAM